MATRMLAEELVVVGNNDATAMVAAAVAVLKPIAGEEGDGIGRTTAAEMSIAVSMTIEAICSAKEFEFATSHHHSHYTVTYRALSVQRQLRAATVTVITIMVVAGLLVVAAILFVAGFCLSPQFCLSPGIIGDL